MLLAARGGHIEAMKWLKEQGAEVNVKNPQGETAMHAAAAGGHVEAMKWLKEQGEDINVKDYCERTPMHCAAEGGHAAAIRWLKEQGADVNAFNNNGVTPLSIAACVNANPEVLRVLIDNGADVAIEDKIGNRALNYAEKKKELKSTEVYDIRPSSGKNLG
jgi:cellulase/cellobiase CelA1